MQEKSATSPPLDVLLISPVFCQFCTFNRDTVGLAQYGSDSKTGCKR